jgi:hypothetical protein
MISSFQILGQTIEVIIDNEYCHKNKCYGQFIPFENKIIIANKFKSKKVWIDYKQEIIDATFYHELIHCLLFYADSESWLDEKLVDKLGNFLHQYIISKIDNVVKI